MSKFKSHLFIGYNFFCSKAMKDYINQIKELQNKNVYIKNKNKVNNLIHEIVNGGANKLQIVTDFDRTLTKQYEPGKDYHTSFGLLLIIILSFIIALFIIFILSYSTIWKMSICNRKIFEERKGKPTEVSLHRNRPNYTNRRENKRYGNVVAFVGIWIKVY